MLTIKSLILHSVCSCTPKWLELKIWVLKLNRKPANNYIPVHKHIHTYAHVYTYVHYRSCQATTNRLTVKQGCRKGCSCQASSIWHSKFYKSIFYYSNRTTPNTHKTKRVGLFKRKSDEKNRFNCSIIHNYSFDWMNRVCVCSADVFGNYHLDMIMMCR